MQDLAITIALVGILGIGAQWIAWRTGWPAIALMMLAGIVAGPVTGVIDPEHDFGHLLEPVISVAVAIILFEGGLSLKFSELKQSDGAVHRLVLIGVPVAWGLGALACYYVAGLVWPVAILFAGILVVTGPTVILPLLRQTNLATRPRAILKWEAIVNDPIGALLAIVTYEWLLQAEQGLPVIDNIVTLITAALAAGIIGYGMARAVIFLFPRGMVPEFLKPPVLLVAVIGTFVISNAIQAETGLLAVTVMGMALANLKLPSARSIFLFKESITILLVSGVFVLLSASLNVQVLQQFELRFIAFLLVLLFVVRPLSVFASLAFTRVPMKERLFVAWIAPRGIVAVAISGLFALRLDEIGYSDGGTLVTLSFAVVAATIIAHGFTIQPLARWLGLTGPASKGVLIVGATDWSLSLARLLRVLEVPVVISDTSRERLAPAREGDIPTFHGEILGEATHEDLDFNQFQLLVATSDNEAYNTLVCNEFSPELGRDNVYQLGDPRRAEFAELPETLRGRAVFGTDLGVEELNRREDAGWRLVAVTLGDALDFDTFKAMLPERAELLLLLRRNQTLRFFTHASQPTGQAGDVVIAYVPAEFEPRFNAAGEALPARQVEPEPAAEVK